MSDIFWPDVRFRLPKREEVEINTWAFIGLQGNIIDAPREKLLPDPWDRTCRCCEYFVKSRCTNKLVDWDPSIRMCSYWTMKP